MARDNTLVYSIKDNGSASLIKITENVQKNRKEIQNLSGKIDELNKKKATLTVDATKAKKELQAARKAFNDTEESAKRLETAQLNYDNLTKELRTVTSESKAAEKQINSLNDTIQKGQNRAGGAAGAIQESGSILSKLGQAGASQLVGQVASEAAGAYFASAFGSEASTMFSSVLGMGASGAAIGSMIAPGIGTAIGAAAGGLLGAVSGATQNFQNRDEYFKSLVQDQYNQYQEDIQNSLTSGSTTAASKEQSRLAFSTLLGSDAAAESFLSELQIKAAATPFSQAGLETIAKNLIANGITNTDEQLKMMDAVGEAGSALGLSEQSMADVATYLGRMNSTGKTNLEYLIPLMERGIPAVDYLAENLGVAKEEVYDMVSQGLIPGEEAARAISDAMLNDFGGSLEKQAQTYNGLVSTLEDAQAQLDAAMGEGYNEARKPAIQEQIDYLSGEGGEEMKRMYSLIGEFQASLENEKEKAIREAMEAATASDEYTQAEAEGNGAEMGRILAEAKAEAEKAYMESDGYQTLIESQTTTIQSVRDTMADSYWEAGYYLGQEFTKGIAAATQESENLADFSSRGGAYSHPMLQNRSSETANTSSGAGAYAHPALRGYTGHAAGLSYVPYNDYPARLHKGERVLTARENREYSSGGNVMVSVNGNLVVREEADIDRIAETIARKVAEAKELLV